MLKVRIKANDRGRGTQLGKSDKEGSSIDQHSCQTNLLLLEKARQHEEGSNKTHRHPKIGDDGALNTLFGDDAHDITSRYRAILPRK